METKQCKNCSNEFTIEPEDFNFYEKIKVPAPTWCPKCRTIRRISCNNGWFLYYRNCDKCGNRTLSMYPQFQKITVYCQPCWWGDSWDGTEYAMDYDPSRPFLEQLKELSEKTSYVALETTYLTLKNSEYCNAIAYSKNCTLASWADYCENVCYSSFLNGAKDTTDSLRINDSELCYRSIGQKKCYRAFFSKECDSCTDIWFSRNCYGCINCLGCVNQHGASYKIFNEQYTKEQYAEKFKEFKLDTRLGLEKFQREAEEFWSKFPYRCYTGSALNLNVTGEYVYESKNSKDMYLCSGAENCRYCQFITVPLAKDCQDYSGWGNNVKMVYESGNLGDKVSDCKFSFFCFPDLIGIEYCFWCTAGKNLFGCVNLKRKSYSILNKQYPKEEYEKLKAYIIEDMKKNPYVDESGRSWHYGEFFQPGFCKFAYNNSNAFKFFPKTKDEVLKSGYIWNEEEPQNFSTTISSNDLPETIAETDDSILKEIIACIVCGRKYKILDLEFGLLKKMGMPIPNQCYRCRENILFSKINKPCELYNRHCNKCDAPITTPYSPDRPEIVYCEKCYQQEVY